MNSRLKGTTMCKISFEGVVALERAGLVSAFRLVYSSRLQENEDQFIIMYIFMCVVLSFSLRERLR